LAAKAASLVQRPAGDGSIKEPHSQARAYALLWSSGVIFESPI